MKEIKFFEEKTQLSVDINACIDKVNAAIHRANEIGLNVTVLQNSKFGTKNSDVCVFINETISY